MVSGVPAVEVDSPTMSFARHDLPSLNFATKGSDWPQIVACKKLESDYVLEFIYILFCFILTYMKY